MTSGYFFSLMPDQKVSDEVGFENFIRMSWGDLEELVEVVESLIGRDMSFFSFHYNDTTQLVRRHNRTS